MYVTHNREFNKTITRSRFVFDTYIITKKSDRLQMYPGYILNETSQISLHKENKPNKFLL